MAKSKPTPDNAGVRLPPPLVYLAALAVGLGADYLRPFPFLAEPARFWGGIGLIAFSFLLVLPALLAFGKAGTKVDIRKPTTALVTGGIYRLSRNPIYLSLTVLAVGIACSANSLWALLMVIPAVAVIQRKVIAREEAYLEAKFGEEYLAYKRRVRRWF